MCRKWKDYGPYLLSQGHSSDIFIWEAIVALSEHQDFSIFQCRVHNGPWSCIRGQWPIFAIARHITVICHILCKPYCCEVFECGLFGGEEVCRPIKRGREREQPGQANRLMAFSLITTRAKNTLSPDRSRLASSRCKYFSIDLHQNTFAY